MAVHRRTSDDSFRIIVAILPGGDTSTLTRAVKHFIQIDFANGLQDPEALGRLFDGVRGKVTDRQGDTQVLPQYRSMALPTQAFVQRPEYADIVDALTLTPDEGLPAARVCLTTALRGAGGFGKTALAQAVCEDPRVRERFPAGILWTTLGQDLTEAERLARLLNLLRWWMRKEPPGFDSVETASAQLRQVLSGQRVLLVIDDLWRAADFAPFEGIATPAALLVTTRNSRSLPSESHRIVVDALAESRAVELLTQGLTEPLPGDRLRRLAKRLGEWPILLRLVNAQLREECSGGANPDVALDLVETELDRAGLTAFDREDEKARNLAVRRTVEASLSRLNKNERASYAKMAVFAEDEQIPLPVLELLWDVPPSEAHRLCRRLAAMSLLYRFDPSERWAQVHDVIRSYLLREHESDIPSYHGGLADRLVAIDERQGAPAAVERYFLTRFAYHLKEGGRRASLEELLFSYPWLNRKIGSGHINSTLSDFDLLNGMPDALAVQRALRLSALVLIEDPGQLAGQLYGRLSGLDLPRLSALLASTMDNAPPAWIRPLSASLRGPTGPMLWSLQAHPGPVAAIAGLGENAFATASSHGVIRIWEFPSGEAKSTLSDGDSTVRTLAPVGDSRLLAASEDGIIRLWDIGGEHVLRRFEAHRSPVSTLCVRGEQFASGFEDGTLLLWTTESIQPLGSFLGHTSKINGIAYLDARTIVSVGADRTLRVWDTSDCHQIRAVAMHVFPAEAVAAIGPNDVVAVNFAGQVQVWQPISTDQAPRKSFRYDTVGVKALCMLNRDLGVSTVGGYSRIRLWNPRRQENGPEVHVPGTAVTSLAKLGSTHLLCGNEDGAVSAWSIEELASPQGDVSRGSVFAVTAIGSIGAASTSDREVRIWNLPEGVPQRTLSGHTDTVNSIVIVSPDKLASSSSDSTIRIWNPCNGQLLQTFSSSEKISAMGLLGPMRLVAAPLSVGEDRPLQIWELDSGRQVGDVPIRGLGVTKMLANNYRLVVATNSGLILHLDLSGGTALNFTLRGHERSVQALARLDDRTIASGGMDQTVRLWDLVTKETVKTLEGHAREVTGLAALSSNLLASASTDRTIKVWELRTSKVIASFRGDTGFSSLAAMPDGRTLVAGDEGGGVHFLDCRLFATNGPLV